MAREAVFRLLKQGEGTSARPTAEDLQDAAALGQEAGARRLERRRRLRALAAETLGVHPDAVRIERRADGTLRITEPEPLYASVAGRGAWTALALGPRPVGVDVETCPSDTEPPFDLLQPLEQDAILADPDPPRLFLRFWAAREAYLKADGRGLGVMPDRVRAAQRDEAVALIEQGRPIAIARLVEREDAIAAIVELEAEA